MTDEYSKADESDSTGRPDAGDAADEVVERAEFPDGAVVGLDDDDQADGDEGGADFVDATDASADDLRGLVLFVASSLVDRPEDVEVHAAQRGQSVQLTLVVPEDELGKVIGRQGRIARAIRTVTMIAGSRHNVRASLDIEG